MPCARPGVRRLRFRYELLSLIPFHSLHMRTLILSSLVALSLLHAADHTGAAPDLFAIRIGAYGCDLSELDPIMMCRDQLGQVLDVGWTTRSFSMSLRDAQGGVVMVERADAGDVSLVLTDAGATHQHSTIPYATFRDWLTTLAAPIANTRLPQQLQPDTQHCQNPCSELNGQ